MASTFILSLMNSIGLATASSGAEIPLAAFSSLLPIIGPITLGTIGVSSFIKWFRNRRINQFIKDVKAGDDQIELRIKQSILNRIYKNYGVKNLEELRMHLVKQTLDKCLDKCISDLSEIYIRLYNDGVKFIRKTSEYPSKEWALSEYSKGIYGIDYSDKLKEIYELRNPSIKQQLLISKINKDFDNVIDRLKEKGEFLVNIGESKIKDKNKVIHSQIIWLSTGRQEYGRHTSEKLGGSGLVHSVRDKHWKEWESYFSNAKQVGDFIFSIINDPNRIGVLHPNGNKIIYEVTLNGNVEYLEILFDSNGLIYSAYLSDAQHYQETKYIYQKYK